MEPRLKTTDLFDSNSFYWVATEDEDDDEGKSQLAKVHYLMADKMHHINDVVVVVVVVVAVGVVVVVKKVEKRLSLKLFIL